jgi:hypothetical protein
MSAARSEHNEFDAFSVVLHPGDDVELPIFQTQEVEEDEEDRRDAALREMVLRWEREQEEIERLAAEAALAAETTALQDAGEKEPLLAIGYVPVAETAPPLERPLKRQAPTLGRVAPLPAVERRATSGEWAARFAALTTATDPLYVLLVGINAVIETRQEHWARLEEQERQNARPPLGLLWGTLGLLREEALLPSQVAETLEVLQREVEQVVGVLEVQPLERIGPSVEEVEQARQATLARRLERLEQMAGRLRKQSNKRRAVRHIAGLLARLAWQALETLWLPNVHASQK